MKSINHIKHFGVDVVWTGYLSILILMASTISFFFNEACIYYFWRLGIWWVIRRRCRRFDEKFFKIVMPSVEVLVVHSAKGLPSWKSSTYHHIWLADKRKVTKTTADKYKSQQMKCLLTFKSRFFLSVSSNILEYYQIVLSIRNGNFRVWIHIKHVERNHINKNYIYKLNKNTIQEIFMTLKQI